MVRLALLVMVAALAVACGAPAANVEAARRGALVAIVGVTVVHPQRQAAPAAASQTVLLDGDRIRAIGPAGSMAVPGDATVIDGRGKWLIPGLIDSHVHFFQSGNPYTRPDVFDLTRFVPYAQEVARNRARLAATFKVWLASGVTSVADVGGPFWNFDVRDAAARTAAAPRVLVAGPLVSLVDDPKLDLGDPPIVKTTSPEAARALVARELRRKPDFIKVWFIHRPGDDLAAQEAIVRAAGEAAHAAGVRFAVHATELETAKAALRAGADVLVHSVVDAPVDDEFLALARKNRIVYIPTLFVFEGYALAAANAWQPTAAERRLADPQILASMGGTARIREVLSPEQRERGGARAARASAAAMGNVRRVWDAGITVAMGTDAGNIGTLHGPSVFREMARMAEAGLTPREVLLAATVNGAVTLGMRDRVGTVEPGKLADLVLLDADPLASVANLENVVLVFKGGRRFDPDELIRSIATR